MRRTLLIGLLAAALAAAFVALGTWQIHRRAWKLDLIARVDARIHAAPAAPPEPAQWAHIGRDDEYRRLRLTGRFRPDRETLVQAVTARGPGWWVLAPLQLADGSLVLVNRGFVDAAHRPAARHALADPAAVQTVTGLLRLSEPKGGFLRANAPADDRWYSRDVVAIGTAQGLPAAHLAPYFVDAEADAAPNAWPIGGLTVVHFRNEHLVYALTWYTLAAMSALGGWIAVRQRPT